MANRVSRLINWANRNRRAWRFGIPYFRARTFRPPTRVRGKTGWIDIAIPQDTDASGVSVDAHAIFVDDAYFLDELAVEPNTVVDIGANIGLFSVCARARWPDAIIHAYDPQPEAWPFLEKNSHTAGVQCFKEAVGREDGWATFACDAARLTNQARISLGDPSGHVRCVSLRTALARIGGEADLVKMDCEGGEWEILRDTRSLARVKYIAMEYHFWALDQDVDGPAHLCYLLEQAQFRVLYGDLSGAFGTLLAMRMA